MRHGPIRGHCRQGNILARHFPLVVRYLHAETVSFNAASNRRCPNLFLYGLVHKLPQRTEEASSSNRNSSQSWNQILAHFCRTLSRVPNYRPANDRLGYGGKVSIRLTGDGHALPPNNNQRNFKLHSIMGKIFLALGALLLISAAMLKLIAIGQKEQAKKVKIERTQENNSTFDRTIVLEPGRKFLDCQNSRWDQSWITTRPMLDSDTPQTYHVDLYTDNNSEPSTRIVIKESK